VVDAVGELVCTQPIPSMPLYFWGDRDGSRYLSSYFDMYAPAMAASPAAATCRLRQGVWRHGDWLRIGAQGGCTIYGRSDATINRHGLRMGTSEIYSAVEALPEVLDSMVVDLEYLGKESYMPLFVVLREGLTLDAALRERHQRCHPHRAVAPLCARRDLPGGRDPAHAERQEAGAADQEAAAGPAAGQGGQPDAMANPGCLPWYEAFAAQYLARQAQAA
jgi:acetoacetyl-CoA synthetase